MSKQEKALNIVPIAYIYNDFNDKFGIPRQSGLVPEMESVIVFEKEYASKEALREIENFSHLWLLWHFSQNSKNEWSPCVRPPRLGGNRRVGVFATRSPFRPNPIGLSSVELKEVKEIKGKGLCLVVTGADLASGTPIFDIKPYIPYTDSHPDAVGGFADEVMNYELQVVFPASFSEKLSQKDYKTVCRLLAQDPRPSYQHDKNRIYAISFGDFEIKFTVDNGVLTVVEVQTQTK